MTKGGSADYGYSMSVELCALCGDAKGLSPGCICTEKKPMTNQQWQPIESAPKDGTWVLLTGGHSGIEVDPIYCGPCVTAFWMGHEWDEGWVYAYWDGGWSSSYEDPTHWMPLPAPPPAEAP